MNILILGGTAFVGRALTEALIAEGKHELTLFNRGKTNESLFKNLTQIHGNRETDDILKICDRHWDVIIDFSGYYPDSFELLMQNLKGKVARYIFISTISVFDLEKKHGEAVNEDDEIHDCSPEQRTSKLPDAYGEKKAEMERILLRQDWLDSIILRPSFIYGRYDWTERFYYYLYHVNNSNRIVLPDTADCKFGLTYYAHLVQVLMECIDKADHRKIYHVISQTSVSLQQVVESAAKALNKEVKIIMMNEQEIAKTLTREVHFPLHVPFNFCIANDRLLADFDTQPEPFEDNLHETILWHQSMNWTENKLGLNLEEEQMLAG